MGNRLTQIATRTGDNGTTGLGDNTRVAKNSLRDSVLTGLRSPALRANFEELHPLDSLRVLLQKTEKRGKAAQADVVAKLSNPKEACFAAGTKVWTDKGLGFVNK